MNQRVFYQNIIALNARSLLKLANHILSSHLGRLVLLTSDKPEPMDLKRQHEKCKNLVPVNDLIN